MKTTLDTFREELEVLLKKYDYVLSKAEETHRVSVVRLDSLFGSSYLTNGKREINLEINAVRLERS